MKSLAFYRWAIALASVLGCCGAAQAQLVINDTLTGATSAYQWIPLNGACLTAGYAGALNPDGSASSIPPCVGLPYYKGSTLVGGANGVLPDAVGSGALRLTNGDTAKGTNGNNQTGAIVSSFTFPTTQGIQVTWSTRTYGGNAYTNNSGVQSGADGISFFLSNGGTASAPIPATVGALGGSLGYSCSNGNGTYDGVLYGYLGIGMDEYGNFSNPGDNTNTPSGGGPKPGNIAVRGAGHTRWDWLNANYPQYYPSSLNAGAQATAVRTTCAKGSLVNYGSSVTINGKNYGYGAVLPIPLDYNYPFITGAAFSGPIFNQEALGTTTTNGVTASNAVRGNALKVTYQLSITSTGLLSFYYALNGGSPVQVFNNTNITASNGPLPSLFRFGFSAGTGGGSNVHEITCFKAAPNNVSGSSGGSNVLSGQVKTGNQLYLAYYHPINSWGSLTAQNLVFSGGVLSVSPNVNWDAGCVLTGGSCLAYPSGSANVVAPLNNTNRTILSWNGSNAVAFEAGGLSSTQNGYLTANDGNNTNTNRLDFMRGKRTLEVSQGGPFRNRTSLLGDIWGSSPLWVGPPSSPYANTWADARWPTQAAPEGSSYAAFAAAKATRTNVVYVGSNDGMLHGFRSGAYDASGNFTGTNDGLEMMAYVPSQVIATIHPVDSTGATIAALDYSNPLYSHNFFVDAPPGQGDLYYANAWHTWLVGGLGAGGQAAGPINNLTTVGKGTIFGLDITNPDTAFSESAPSQTVIGELTSTSLSAAGSPCPLTNCGDYLGMTYGTPLIRRLHDGTWGVLFGNGYNSKKGTAGLFIAHVDPASGNVLNVQFLNTGKSGPTTTVNGVSTTTLNGIGQVTAVDLDGDHITDYVYAGDVLGNLWRFDLTSNVSTNWSAGAKPLFTTQANQPITSGVAVDVLTTMDQNGGTSTAPKVIVAFGTGQQLPQTLASAPVYPTTMQSLYGIWDADMSGWNSKATVQLASLPTASIPTIVPGSGTIPGGSAGLLVHTMSSTKTTDVTSTVCWYSTTACTGKTNNQMGWEMDLSVQPAANGNPQTAEQAIYNPTIVSDVFNINTMIPTVAAQTLTCDSTTATAYSVGVAMATGGATATAYFAGTAVGTVAVATQGTGTSTVVTASDGSTWLVFQKNDGTGGTQQINVTKSSASTGSRLTWTKVR